MVGIELLLGSTRGQGVGVLSELHLGALGLCLDLLAGLLVHVGTTRGYEYEGPIFCDGATRTRFTELLLRYPLGATRPGDERTSSTLWLVLLPEGGDTILLLG